MVDVLKLKKKLRDTLRDYKKTLAEIKRVEPTFQAADSNIENIDQPEVVWNDKPLDKHQEEELKQLEEIRHMAYIWARRNHPKQGINTDKFGQIVNARMSHIIAWRS
ncbi:MAG: hypothetical protein GWN01_01395 [Nitrosopumilaceae archaeon]|nr:hypothetical protein [Nitrosopumilaceae archaeon]NIU86013.1 hypothetical protein [Nitrosopumilaceae archaeon]NIX60232.1 hypothetical protein [Nitrosopumilaceae archaeon]